MLAAAPAPRALPRLRRSPGHRRRAAPLRLSVAATPAPDERRACRAGLSCTRMAFPATRLRRLRSTGALRDLVRETELAPRHLVQPAVRRPRPRTRRAPDRRHARRRPPVDQRRRRGGGERRTPAASPAVLLFGLPADKDEEGSGAWDDEGVVQLAIRAIKDACPDAARHHRRVPVRVHLPRPLRRAALPTARSTTTPRSSCSRARPSRRPTPAPTWSPPAT